MALFKPNRNQPSLGQHPFSELPLILASGVGRSGTTVLRHCLAAHPSVASYNYECNYIFELMRAVNLHMERSPKPAPAGKAEFLQLHRQALLELYWSQADWKDPQKYSALSTYSMLDPRAAIGLKDVFPRLAICYIVRNGIEVVSSYVSFQAFQHMSFEQACRLWALRHDMFQYQSAQKHVFLFRHQWMLEQPDRFKQELSDAFGSIGMTFDDNCLTPLTKQFHPTRFDGEDHDAASDPARRIDRWKLWTDQQRSTFVTICGEAMGAHGYEIPWI